MLTPRARRWIRLGLLPTAVIAAAVAFQVASAPAALAPFSLDRLRLGGAGGAEDYVYTAGNVIFPQGGSDSGKFYKFVVTDSAGVTRNSPACRPASDFPTADNTYTIRTTDPISTSAGWKYTLNQYTTSSCTGSPSKTANKVFYVAKATAYADAALTTPRSAFKAGETAYVVVYGAKPGTNDLNVSWILPSGAVACANTAGSNRPDSLSTGTVPKDVGTWLQYRPNTTAIGSAWNRESNYETVPCPTFGGANQGLWTLRLQVGGTSDVLLPVFTIDIDPPPTPTIDSHPPDPSNSATAGFTFSDAENGVSFRCRLDGVAFSPCMSPTVHSGLADGAHSFQVIARDAAVNESAAASFTWTVDTTPPAAPTINSHPATPSNSASASFGFSGEAGSSFLCKLDGASFATCTSPAAYSGLTEGAHSFQVKARDLAGNESPAASFTWTIDLTPPPAPTIASHPADPSNSTSANFNFSGESGAGFLCRLDGATFATCMSPTLRSGLTAGPHTFQVKARDGAGNESPASSFTWTIDTTPPPVPTIDSHAADPSNSASASFSFSDAESGASLLCRLDGAAFASCTSPASYSNLSDGAHSFQVRARDGAGNESAAVSFTWAIDTTPPPTPTIDSYPPDPSNSASAGFIFSDTETGASFLCKLDGAAFASCTSPASYSNLLDGAHTFDVKARDDAGNESAPASYTWLISIPPAVTLTSPADGSSTNDPTPTFAGQGGLEVGDGPTVTVKVYAGPTVTDPLLETLSATVELTGSYAVESELSLSDGTYTARAEQSDTAGNTGFSTANTFVVDSTLPPEPTIDSHPPDPSASTDASFSFSDTESGVSLLCRLDGDAFASCTSPASYSNLSDGAHSFEVKARDGAGNESAPASYTWLISTPPAVTLMSPADGSSTNDPTPTFAGQGGLDVGDGPTVTVKVYAGPNVTDPLLETLSATVDLAGSYAVESELSLSDGTYTARAEQSDTAGNTGFSTANTFVVDTTPPPTPTIDSYPPDPSNSASAGFTFSDTETGASFLCKLDGAAFASCTSPASYSNFLDGAHTFEVKARDGAGNESAAASFAWTIDTIAPPTPTIDSHPPDPSASTDASFAFSDTESGVSLLCRLDGDAFASCTSPASYSNLSDGAHSFQVKARDAAGNESAAASFAWTIDATPPPTPTIDLRPPDPSASRSANFTFSDSETGVSFFCRLDGDGFSACTSPVAYSGLVEGPHTFEVKARDGAGNESAPASYTWLISIPPAVTLTSPTDGSSTTDPTPTFAGQGGMEVGDDPTVTVKVYAGASVTDPPVETLLATMDFTGSYAVDSGLSLSDGTYTARAEQSDAAGNTGFSAANTFVVDTTPPPTPTIDSHPPDPTNSASAGFTASDTESGVSLRCRLDGASFATCMSPMLYSGLAPGSHTFQVKARDAADNESAPASFTWTIDTTPPPTPTIDSHPPNSSNSTSAGFTFSDSESGVAFLCRLDGPSYTACTSPASYSGLAPGSHTFQVKARDTAGNESGPATFTWTIDTTSPPTPTIDSHPTDPSNSASGSFTFSDTETGATFVCQLDGAGFATCTSPAAYSNLSEGSHTFQVKARDAAGNESSAASFTWTVDATSPRVTLANPAHGSVSGNLTPTFTGMAGILTGDIASVVVKLYAGSSTTGPLLQTLTTTPQPNGSYSVAASSALAEGRYTARAEQQDVAGNIGFSTANTFAITSGVYPQEVMADNPRAYWRLGETSGTAAADLAGGNTGTYTGGVTLGQPSALVGDTNPSASFDGVDDYVLVPDANSLDLTSGATVEAWVKRSKSAAFQVIVGKPGNGQSRFENYALWLDTSNQLIAYFGDGVGYVQVVAPAIDTNWHYVVGTYDNATARIYVDGVLKASAGSTIHLTANALPLNLGRANNSTAYSFGGRLDEVAVYPTALAVGRIQAHYGAGLGIDAIPPSVTLVSPANGSATSDTTPTLAGTAGTASGDSATVTVTVYSGGSVGGTPVRTMTATRQPGGSYSVDVSPLLADGTYTAQAEQTDTAGNVGRSSANTFSVDTIAPAPTLVNPANGSVKNPPPTFAGQAGIAPGDASSVTIKVYAGTGTGGTLVRTLATVTGGGGSFSVDAAPPLADGTYTAQVEQFDAAGNLGRSAANTFTVTSADVTPPTITLSAPVNGSRTSDTTPSFSGTAGIAPGDSATVVVKLYTGSVPSGTPIQTLSATRNGIGAYSIDAAPALTEGTYTAQAEQSDTAGNTGQSAPTTFAIDTTSPTIVLNSPADGSSTSNARPSFSGTAGTAAGDASSVAVKLYSGADTTGTLVQALTPSVGVGGAYSILASSNLQPGTYTARAEQSDTAGNVGHSSANTFTILDSPPVMLVAGDISTCGSGNPGSTATALLLDEYPAATVVPLGDTAYDNGQPADFVCYDQTWGRAKDRSLPLIGDHEYATVNGGTPPGVGYFNYFHDQLAPYGAAATDPSRGWYSYDLGAWHVAVLNASCYYQLAPGCDAEAQEQWLDADLTANQGDCTIVMWHKPRFSSGSVQGNYLASQQLWETSYAHGVDLVLSGDDHDFERFARMDPAGALDPQYGIREMVVGTGGYWTYPFSTIQPNSEARIESTWGVLKLTLHPGSYDWQFLPVAGSSGTDSGNEACHPPAPPAVGGPTVRSVSSATANHPAPSLTVAKPAGTVQGDLLLAILAHQGGSGTNMTPPAGWTAVPNTDYSDGTNVRSHAWYKFAGAAEPASYTFTLSDGEAISGGMLAISGARASPIDASLGQVSGTNSRFVTAPSITTSGPALLVYAGAVNAPVFFAPPAYMSERWDRRTSGQYNVALETATQQLPSAGPTGVRTGYLLEGAHGPATLIAIAPAP